MSLGQHILIVGLLLLLVFVVVVLAREVRGLLSEQRRSDERHDQLMSGLSETLAELTEHLGRTSSQKGLRRQPPRE